MIYDCASPPPPPPPPLSMQKLNSGKLAETDDFVDYVELVESPVKAILITNR